MSDSQHMTKHLPNVLSPDIFKELVQLQGRKLRKSGTRTSQTVSKSEPTDVTASI